jgi:hypothetical protein
MFKLEKCKNTKLMLSVYLIKLNTAHLQKLTKVSKMFSKPSIKTLKINFHEISCLTA